MGQPILAANWKMNLGRPDEALDFVRRIRHPLNEIEGVERLPALHCPCRCRRGDRTDLDRHRRSEHAYMHWEAKGAFTGEISPSTLTGLCQFVILGHSERRSAGGGFVTDSGIQRKVRAALDVHYN